MSSVSIPSEYRSELSNDEIGVNDVQVMFTRNLTKTYTFKNSSDDVGRGTKETDDKDNGSYDYQLVRKPSAFQQITQENQKLNKLSQNGYAPLMKYAQSQYEMQCYTACFLAMLSIGVCIIEHEIFIDHGRNKHDGLRMALLCIHIFITGLL